MMRRFWFIAACLAMTPLRADALDVVADIAPIHSLVAMVTGDLATPQMLIDPSASPHSYAMRPSEAASLQDAQLVIWVGAELTPWLEGPIETLAGEARVLGLLEHPATARLAWREEMSHAEADGHGHDDDHDHDHDHDHAAKDDDHDHDHDHEAKHEDHDHDHGNDHAAKTDSHDHDHGHDHGGDGSDPHAWLDPRNASVWLGLIAEELAALDPGNAEAYRANAAAAQAELATLSDTLETQLSLVRDQGFVVYHDAYHYFETAFGVRAVGSVSLSDASSPSAARVTALRDRIEDFGVRCAMAEPQFDTRILTNVLGGDIRIGELDPLGADLDPGAALYPALLRNMAEALVNCLGPES